jgi:hypothetical protein
MEVFKMWLDAMRASHIGDENPRGDLRAGGAGFWPDLTDAVAGRDSMPDDRTCIRADDIRLGGQASLRSRVLTQACRRSLALWIWSALVMADIVLVSRRLAGGFEFVIPSGLSFFSTLVVACGSWSAWIVLRSTQPVGKDGHTIRRVSLVFSLVLTLTWISAVSGSVSSLAFGLLIGIFGIQCAAIFAWESHSVELATSESELAKYESSTPSNLESASSMSREVQPNSWTSMNSEDFSGVDVALNASESALEEFEESAEDTGDDVVADDVSLWLSRRSVEAGELVEGWARAEFTGGQREVIVHIAFCPPLPLVPTIETEDLDGAGLQIRVAASFPFGARLSVRRVDSVIEPQNYRIGFVATAASANRAA